MNIQFVETKLVWSSYIASEALPITIRVKLINKQKFAEVTFAEVVTTFVVYMSSFNLGSMTIHPVCEAQMTALLTEKVTVLTVYNNFPDVFSKKSAEILQEKTGINEYFIKLVDSKQPCYKSIYNLSLVDLETLKSYIKTNLANSFIQLSKSLVIASILFA